MFKTRFLDVPPLERAAGTVRLPGSKSISNRVLLLAGLCAGSTRHPRAARLRRRACMLDALRALGCGVEAAPHSAHASHGLGGRPALKTRDLLPRQRRHGDAAADGDAGALRRLVRCELRAARHAAHARAADRRPGRHPARARLRRRMPGAARAIRRCASRPARARFRSPRRSRCAATSRASSSAPFCSPCPCAPSRSTR